MNLSNYLQYFKSLFEDGSCNQLTFRDLLDKISEEAAFRVAAPQSERIAQLVHRLTLWRERCLARMASMDTDFPPLVPLDLAALRQKGWQSLCEDLLRTQDALLAFLGVQKDAFLTQALEGNPVSYWLNDWIAQDAFYLGQIGLLLKLLPNTPPNTAVDTASIKLLLLDVDGVLTDGGMYYTENGDYMKKFNAKDGLAIRRAERYGLEIGLITSSTQDRLIRQRAETLKIKLLHIGDGKKQEIVARWLTEKKMDWTQVAYIGDDLNDWEVMQQVGLAVCPADACRQIKAIAKLVLQSKGGEGCVREFIEDIMGIELEKYHVGSQVGQ